MIVEVKIVLSFLEFTTVKVLQDFGVWESLYQLNFFTSPSAKVNPSEKINFDHGFSQKFVPAKVSTLKSTSLQSHISFKATKQWFELYQP